LFDRFLSTPEMVEVFSAPALVQGMLDFESALARAQASSGLIPASAARAIAQACDARFFDLDVLVAQGSVAGTLAIPLVRQLTARVALTDPAAAGWVHWGSTSQDVLDTAMVLATRRALALIDDRLVALTKALSDLEHQHGPAPMLGRTLLQPALVISVGFKLLSWTAPLVRARQRLQAAAEAALQLQLGGAVGTRSVLGEQGAAVAKLVADDLDLAAAEGAWHTQRDSWVALGCEIGLLCGSLGKIATDLALLAQAEVGEMAEPEGGAGAGVGGVKRGGSSAMPHKRNPVAAMIARAAAQRAPQHVAALLATMPQEHERGLGGWQAELAEWPGLFLSAHGALTALADAMAGLSVDTQRMRRNIDALDGLVFAEGVAVLMAPPLGKARAHALLEDWSRQALAQRRPLQSVVEAALAANPSLGTGITPEALRAVFDPVVVAQAAQAGVAQPWARLRSRMAELDAIADAFDALSNPSPPHLP
jgi:3-carboxy-cis,cis-muconate cycloisomerase